MPAVTTNTLKLPKVIPPYIAGTTQPRRVLSITEAPQGFEGEGFPVRRAFAGVPPHLLDPFIHMDQMGEVNYAPGEPKGTPWHPHRGFETFTYLMDGEFLHQDSTGGGGSIKDGETQYMTCRERKPRPSGRGKRAVSPGAADFRCTGTHALEDSAEVVDVLGVQRFVLVLRHEDQVGMWC